jgi:hypothetical protein
MDAANTLLLGVVGSHAYGLARPDSDIDRLGVYAAPTIEFHGLNPPTAKQATRHTTDPDLTMHEAGKYARLALACNPTVMELLWLPEHEAITPLGRRLVVLRRQVLSAKLVRDSYLGYATQQFVKLKQAGRFPDVPVARVAKHARHLLRLVEAGTHLWVTGRLVLKVPDAARVFEFGDRVADGDTEAAKWVIRRAEETFCHSPTVLPDRPDTDSVERWLLDVRAAHYRPTTGS